KLLWDALVLLDRPWTLLREMDIRIVHTYRANALDSFISFRLATINTAFTRFRREGKLIGDYKTQKFAADFSKCRRWFEMTEFRDGEVQRCSCEQGISRLSVEYEELCQ